MKSAVQEFGKSQEIKPPGASENAAWDTEQRVNYQPPRRLTQETIRAIHGMYAMYSATLPTLNQLSDTPPFPINSIDSSHSTSEMIGDMFRLPIQ